jgi:isoleucyl-tRNA synthetase
LDGFIPTGKLNSTNILDAWLLSKTTTLIQEVTESLEKYDLSKGAKALLEYIDELSNWYIRRSRKRFWKSENDGDKNAAYEVLYYALTTYIHLLAPYMPFVTEAIYQNLVLTVDKKAPGSIHLAKWPTADKGFASATVEAGMDEVRKAVEAGLAARNTAGIKVRQPLASLSLCSATKLTTEMLDIVSEEVNVKKVSHKISKTLSVDLDTKITKELKGEGVARDFIRFIQDGRKKAGFNVEDRIVTYWVADDKAVRGWVETWSMQIAKETLSSQFEFGLNEGEYSETVKLDGKELSFTLKRI